MTMGFWILCGVMAIGTLAFWHSMKVWSVTVIGFNLMFATLFSMGCYAPLANMLDGAAGVMSYYNDMLVFMLLFLLILTILMLVTKKFSAVDLAFSEKTDKIAKWIVCFVVILGFSGTAIFVFYETMPEKPAQPSILPTMKMVDISAKGALSPLMGGAPWDTKAFADSQYRRNAGVYEGTLKEGAAGWKFDGDSPNAQ